MKKKKKLFSILLSVIMLFTMMPAAAFAGDGDGGDTTSRVPEAVALDSVLGQEPEIQSSVYEVLSDVNVYTITADVTVYGAESVSADDVVASDSGAQLTFYGEDSTFTTESDPVALTAGGDTNVYVRVVSADPAIRADYTLAISCEEALPDPAATVTSVTISGSNRVGPSVPLTLSATVRGENNPPQTVTWSLSGHSSENTTISALGVLTAGSDETANTLTVTATSAVDPTKYATKTIMVMKVLSIAISPETAVTTLGGKLTFSCAVTGSNLLSNGMVNWSITGATSANTKLPTTATVSSSTKPTLTVGSDEEASSLTVTVTASEDTSKAASATVTMKIIPDPALNEALRIELGKEAGYEISTTDLEALAGLTALDLSDQGITDISGLMHTPNLTSLNLSGNAIDTDTYWAIEKLTGLESLDLSYCSMWTEDDMPTSLSENASLPSGLATALRSLTQLKSLNLSGNKIFSISISLPSLETLNISDNRIAALRQSLFGFVFRHLSGCTNLNYLDVSNNYLDFSEGSDSLEDVGFYETVIGASNEEQNNLSTIAMLEIDDVFYKADPADNTVDIGDVLGNSINMRVYTWALQSAVELIGHESAYKASYAWDTAQSDISVQLPADKDSFTIASTHENGDSSIFTIKYNNIAIPEGSAGIDDGSFQIAVCDLLGQDPETYQVTQEDMASFTGTLNLNGRYLNNVNGLEYAVNIEGINLASNNLTDLPDLSNLTKLTYLGLSSNKLTKVPDCVNSLSALESLNFNGNGIAEISGDINNLKKLTALDLRNNRLSSFPDLSSLSGIEELNIAFNYLSDLPGDLSGLRQIRELNISSNFFTEIPYGIFFMDTLESFDFSNCRITEIPAGFANLGLLTRINGAANRISSISDEIANMSGITSIALNNNYLEEIPDLSGMNLTVLDLSGNRFEAFPAEKICGIESLGNLNFSGNSISEIPGSIAGLTNLTYLDISDCGLIGFPDGVFSLTKLASLYLEENRISAISGDWSGLSSLQNLNLGYNRLEAIPDGLGALTGLKRLYLDNNRIASITSGQANSFPSDMTLIDINYNFIKWGSDSEAAAALNVLLEKADTVTYNDYAFNVPFSYAALKELNYGAEKLEIDIENSTSYDLEVNVAEGTETLNLTPVSVLEDTVITYGEETFASGGTITVSGLQPGSNDIVLTAINAYDSKQITYNINIYVGEKEEAVFPTEGHTYGIQVDVLQYASDSESMAGAYMEHTVTLEVEDGVIYAYFVTTDSDILYDVKYLNSDLQYVNTTVVEDNAAEKTLTHKIIIQNLTDAVYLSGYSVPMGYAPIWRMVFKTDTLIDLTTGEGVGTADLVSIALDTSNAKTEYYAGDFLDLTGLVVTGSYDDGSTATFTITAANVTGFDSSQPAESQTLTVTVDGVSATYTISVREREIDYDNLEDGVYTIDADALKETSDEYSMTNQFLTEDATLAVEGGEITLTMVWHGTEFIPMTMVEGLWYRNSAGEFAEITRDIDAENNTLAFSMPLAGITEPTMMRVYAPAGMGETYPQFRLVFNLDTLTPETPEGEIEDGEYTIPVRLWHATSDHASMGDAALIRTAKLSVEDGQGSVQLEFNSLYVEAFDMTGYLANLKLATDIVFNSLGGIESATLTDAEVISRHDGVWDSFNHPETGSDENIKGTAYPKVVSIPVELEEEYTYVQVYVPVMEAISTGSGTQYARMKLDWAGLTAVGEPNPDADPVQEIDDQDGDGAIELTQDNLNGLSDTDNVKLSAGGASMNIPAQYLNGMFTGASGAVLRFEAKESPTDTKNAVFQLLGDDGELAGAFDLDLTLGAQSITDLGGRVKITLSLTDGQVAALQSADSMKLFYYNPSTGELTDMNAAFDLTARTVTFYTDHFSTYAIVGTTSDGGAGEGGGGGGGGDISGPLEDGTYSIEVDALKETSNSKSMADQFFIEPAELKVRGGVIKVTVVMYGTESSPELSTGIKMSMIKELMYKKDGSWVDAIKKLDEDEDSLKLEMTVSSLDDIYMRCYVPEGMGETRQIFRLVFDRDTLAEGSVDFGSGATVEGDYVITARAGEGGSISPRGKVGVYKNKDQAFTITADTGYKIKDVLVDDKSVGAVSAYTFEKVTADHTIAASFEAAGTAAFKDIKGHWAEKAIAFVVEKGILNGISETEFAPDTSMTRGMFVTVLGRMSEVDTVKYNQISFSDVKADKYYAPYVEWAVVKGIAKGTGDGGFAPDREVTREEVSTMYAAYRKVFGLDQPAGSTATQSEVTVRSTVAITGSALKDGTYEIDATARKETSDELSMADQFLTENATLTVKDEKIVLSMTWYGTQYITMDMLKELKYQKADGSFAEVSRTLSADDKNMTISVEIDDIGKPVIMQVYVPEGMGESRPKFRLMLEKDTLKEISASAAASSSTADLDLGFADQNQISSWAKEGVKAMKGVGLFKGDTNNNFNPKKSMTRAEAAMLLARSLGFTE